LASLRDSRPSSSSSIPSPAQPATAQKQQSLLAPDAKIRKRTFMKRMILALCVAALATSVIAADPPGQKD
jgi:hypothetical protein